MILKLEKYVMNFGERLAKLKQQGFTIVGIEEDSIVLFKKDRTNF